MFLAINWNLTHLNLHKSRNLPFSFSEHRGVDKSLARPGRKQARNHVRDARDFNNIEMRAVIKFVFLLGKALKEIHVILTEILACFLPGGAKDLSASSAKAEIWTLKHLPKFLRKVIGASHGHYDTDRVENRT